MPDPDWLPRLSANVAQVREALTAAARRAGRDPAEVRVVAVTKYAPPYVLAALPTLGLPDLGENRVQQLVARAQAAGAALTDWPADPPAAGEARPRWHMIGHLQRNKVHQLLPHARILHSLDSPRLAEALEHAAAPLGLTVEAFIEVNVAGEASKDGIPPDEATRLAEVAGRCPHLRLRGLMTMAPYNPDPEAARPCFAALRDLLADLRKRGVVGPDCRYLSMGMSQDYPVAIEEGATFIRIGSALFEGLPTTDPRV